MDVDNNCTLLLLDTNTNTYHEPSLWFPSPELTDNPEIFYKFDENFHSKISFQYIPDFKQPYTTSQIHSPFINLKLSRNSSIDDSQTQDENIRQKTCHMTFQGFTDYGIGPPHVVVNGKSLIVCSGELSQSDIIPENLTKSVINGDDDLQKLLEKRRQLSFLHQWKRNALFFKLWNNLNPDIFNNSTKLREYARQLQDIFPQTFKQNNRSWTLLESSNFEKLESDLSEMYAHLASKQRSTTLLKQKVSRMSRYFFEMLAEAKECERRMYECELFIEEKIYGRRDFISKMNERNKRLVKQAANGDTALAVHTTITSVNDYHTTNPLFPHKNEHTEEDNSHSFDDSAPNGCEENQGVRRTMYRKMEEQGGLDGYASILKELSEYIFSRGNEYIYQFPTILSELSWLNESDDTRPTIPPSQDNFRDGTLYTTCVYAEIRLMIILRATLTAFKNGIENKKLAVMLQQIMDSNNELYELKRKLDSGRCALYKKLKLHWAERNSKWNCFPPLKRGYRLLNMLGKGGFAEVWEVFDPITLTVQAAKLHILSPDMELTERGNVVMRVKNEIDIHKSCRTHQHIVDMKACFEMGDNMLATILELCEDGDLDRYIKVHGPVSEELAIIWTSQILEGLLYMKHLPLGRVHHCDLKPGNILFHKGIIKLADFGLSQMVPADSTNTIWTGGGTLWYQPPECLLANFQNTPPLILTDKIDMWAVGCILYEMLFCTRPFGTSSLSGTPSEQLYNEALKGVNFPSSFKQVSNECKIFIEKLLAFNPESRLSIEEALRSPIIKNRTKSIN